MTDRTTLCTDYLATALAEFLDDYPDATLEDVQWACTQMHLDADVYFAQSKRLRDDAARFADAAE